MRTWMKRQWARRPWLLTAGPLALVVAVVVVLVLLSTGDDCCPEVRSSDQWYLVLTSLPVWWVALATLVVSAGLVLIVRAASRLVRAKLSYAGAVALAVILTLPGTFLASMIVTVANVRLDTSQATSVPVTVLDLIAREKTRDGRRTVVDYAVVVTDWDPDAAAGDQVRIVVSWVRAQRIQPGDTLVLRTHPGFLGGVWVEADSLTPAQRG